MDKLTIPHRDERELLLFDKNRDSIIGSSIEVGIDFRDSGFRAGSYIKPYDS